MEGSGPGESVRAGWKFKHVGSGDFGRFADCVLVGWEEDFAASPIGCAGGVLGGWTWGGG